MNIQDVPSPIDLRNPQDALNWANEANDKRPWRYDFFDYYVSRRLSNTSSKSETLRS